MINLFKKGFFYLAITFLAFVSIGFESASAADLADYEEGVTNLNNTPENSAVVGSRLLKPEIGWKRYDVPNSLVKYTNMHSFSSSSLYKGTRIEGTAKDMSFTFFFEGTKFMLLDFIYSNRATFSINIDGVSESASAKGGDSSSQTVFYKKVDLPYGKHKVQIDITNNIKNEYFAIDAIDVDGFLISENDIPNTDSITLDKNNLELSEGEAKKLTAVVTPDSANIIWTSSDESIATVDQNGKVTAIKEGVITVTAQIANTNITANCIVTVKKQGSLETESITLNNNTLELLEGSKDKLTVTIHPENTSNKKVIWTSSDESIATVDQDGNVTAIREGQAIITAKIENTDIAASSTVIVKKPINESSSAILSITLVNGITKEYDVTNTVLNNYLNWFESAQGTSTFKFTKTISPYKKVTEYIVHDKIASFEVREY
ncbi:Ig-like domain-containing protein [Lysinibacillus varians]|uniref:Ig domain-containing protein n=1 Tax=Lysinibacillus varians TaxID=1145276 RepID=A0ABY2TB18_9BACI|nr:Ig-like domain-containing protein [Lysinibacillus varians]AHN22062.1 hypothetical protein T479_12385 [Lysinibacillus varians]TKI52640.1 Ig domain-containing protein [Lysinibacillus varians]